MSGFNTDWLSLREPVDLRSRSGEIADALQARFMSRDTVRVVDLGCGTGSNLRASSQLLPAQQHWVLVDYDNGLLTAARAALTAWAEEASDESGVLKLKSGRNTISVTFRKLDLARDLETALGETVDLVTASAFFDLVSRSFIKGFAKSVAARGAAFQTTLTYNGITEWTPRHPMDREVLAAFHAHQKSDKGFGEAAGPTAAAELADAFRLQGYSVLEGHSPWHLGERDQRLTDELFEGYVSVAKAHTSIDRAALERWAGGGKTGAVIGHTDTLAAPL